ncbi:HD-GYP domain-containing protein [Aneurinibacillus danicus]|jgi:HD-GYP domain-containing protein (c-di-GMP phosphodiesterase class II)|uniref:C-di-GMP phosphodiesterase n=1 Tax=Aneurinibacillus danicus TaxID=267746 RepID=A0A511V1R7_9BACL|nr:HD domain-containing phosphohydrolase [Aneurinibacillus danicus]GEN32856.1 c-di-GMP phosphodiesterase [Aneurinibacillus danicus]
MRHVSLDSLEAGQVLAKSIYASDGRTLLSQGVLLTPGMVNKLHRIGVTMVYIEDSRFEDIKVEEVVSEETRREAISHVSNILECVQEGKNFDTTAVSKTMTNIIEEILAQKDVMLNLDDIRTKDNYLFIHSLNVCIMSTVIGINLGYSVTKLKELALGALLHDIGKVIKNTDDPLKRYSQEGDHHAWVGFNVLRKRHELSLSSAHIALQHHEHVDGTGEPRNLKGPEIHEYAKIVAVTNFYDNLISPFAPEPTLLPYQANEYLMGLAGKKFDHNIVIQFLRSIAMYPTGSSVQLSTGEIGVVVGQHKGLPSRPLVRVFKETGSSERDKFAYDHTEVKEYDLAKETTVFIRSILKS